MKFIESQIQCGIDFDSGVQSGVQVHAGVQIGVQKRLFKTCFP